MSGKHGVVLAGALALCALAIGLLVMVRTSGGGSDDTAKSTYEAVVVSVTDNGICLQRKAADESPGPNSGEPACQGWPGTQPTPLPAAGDCVRVWQQSGSFVINRLEVVPCA